MTELHPVPARQRPRTRLRAVEEIIETILFGARWVMAPIYLGLAATLVVIVVQFIKEFVHAVETLFSGSGSDVVLTVLSLIDLSLAGNLVQMVAYAGYESFVSKIHTADPEDRPEWMGKIGFGGLKLKLIASIVAISAIHLLRSFMNVDRMSKDDILWQVVIHIAFVVSGVMLAYMDRISGDSEH